MALEKIACITLETYYYTVKQIVELVLVYPEQIFEKIERYTNRIINVTLFEILKYANQFKKWIIDLKNAIVNNASYKKIMRICNDLFRCQKFIELIASACGISKEDIASVSENFSKFQKLVCQGNWAKIALDLLNSYIAIANSYLAIVKTAISYYLGFFFDFLVDQYHRLLNQLKITYNGTTYTIKQILDAVDSLAQCVFGLCNVHATATNWTADVRERLNINQNGRFKKTEFLKGFNKELNKGLNELLSLEIVIQDASDVRKYYEDKKNFTNKASSIYKTTINDPARASWVYATEQAWKNAFHLDTIFKVR